LKSKAKYLGLLLVVVVGLFLAISTFMATRDHFNGTRELAVLNTLVGSPESTVIKALGTPEKIIVNPAVMERTWPEIMTSYSPKAELPKDYEKVLIYRFRMRIVVIFLFNGKVKSIYSGMT